MKRTKPEGVRVMDVKGWEPSVAYIKQIDDEFMLHVERYFDSVLHHHGWSMWVYLRGHAAKARGIPIGQEGVWREGMVARGALDLEHELEEVLVYAKEHVLPRARAVAAKMGKGS